MIHCCHCKTQIPDEYAVLIDSLTTYAEAMVGKPDLVQELVSSALLLDNMDYAALTVSLACIAFLPLHGKIQRRPFHSRFANVGASEQNGAEGSKAEEAHEIPAFVLEALDVLEKKKKAQGKESMEETDPNMLSVRVLQRGDKEAARKISGENVLLTKRLMELIADK